MVLLVGGVFALTLVMSLALPAKGFCCSCDVSCLVCVKGVIAEEVRDLI